MRALSLFVVSGLILGLVACASMQKPIPDTQLGLSKTSAFDTTTPKAYTLDGKGAKGAAEAAYGMPPLIPHSIATYTPITAQQNLCLSCHNRTSSNGKVAGAPTSIPGSHYLRTGGLNNMQYYCVACHQPAAEVPDLVINNGPKPKR